MFNVFIGGIFVVLSLLIMVTLQACAPGDSDEEINIEVGSDPIVSGGDTDTSQNKDQSENQDNSQDNSSSP